MNKNGVVSGGTRALNQWRTELCDSMDFFVHEEESEYVSTGMKALCY